MDKVLLDRNDCCGCEACFQVCPTKAISMEHDKYGFTYSKINTQLCIDCGKCQQVCPALNPVKFESKGENYVLSAFANDDNKRMLGSSGGVFGLLAESVLSKGGVVYGAAFDENLQLRHIEVSDVVYLPHILKSKYIQSHIGTTFISVRKRLSQGKTVLFCGTPCQCLALYNFLGRKHYDNLILVDFICHGVPSQKFFDKSIMSWESKTNRKVERFSFRYKCDSDKTEAGLRYWRLKTKDGREYKGRYIKFPFYYAYLRYMFFRPSCYSCQYCKIERCTDITLGDFWGLRNIKNISIKEFNKGYSMLIVNTAMGKELISNLDLSTTEYPIHTAVDNNYAYTHPTIQSEESKHFFNDYDKLPWADLERKYMIIKTDLVHRGFRFIKRMIKKWLRR